MSVQSPESKFVTEEALREWKNSNSSFKLPEAVPMPRFLYELCWAMVRGDLPFQKLRTALDSATFASEHSDDEVDSILADIVAHMGQDHTMPGENRSRLIRMAKWLVESSLVPCRFFQERCEEEFLSESDLSKIKAQDLKAKEVRVNTRLLYQQTKFNLLREESEGYAKLVTLLCHSGLVKTDNASAATVSIIKSLIGHFDLDPNRVFDIVLECFELHPDCNFFYGLVPMFPKSHASQILGFKFQYYQRMEVNSVVPFGLYRLAALLIRAELIDLDSIYAHLLPKDIEAFEHYDVLLAKRLEMVNKIGKINLAATGKDLTDEEKPDFTVDLFSALDMEAKAVSERAQELENNQSLGLLIGFLFVEDWYHAQILFDRLSHLNPVEHTQVCEGLFRNIERAISSVYSVVCQVHSESIDVNGCLRSSPFVDLPKELFQMLTVAGPYLYRDSILLQKVCRTLKAYYVSAHGLVHSPATFALPESCDDGKRDAILRLKEARQKVEEAMGSCLLPSLQLIPANPAVGQEIWGVLSLLPYEARYRLYGEWEKDDEQIPVVLAARQTAKLDTRRILKRLAKENLKQHGRTVAKLAHSNPVTVIRTIIPQIEAYKDMITPVVDAFKYLTQLEYDILEYVVIERLAQGGRDRLKEDGLNLSDWLQSLASFWGHLCKKYPSMELRGLFDYLVNQLKRGNGIELVVLQELMQHMANVQYTENMTEEQLDAMAGSETLRSQFTMFGMSKTNKALSKSITRLRDALFPRDGPNQAISLLLLIAQHRSIVAINADAPHIKVVSEQFDRCHGTLLQYVEFLSSAVTPDAYAQLVPTLDDLVHTYHLDAEVAFLIYRPVMRLFKCAGDLETYWPLSIPQDTENHPAEKESELSSLTPTKWLDLIGTVRSMLPSRAWNSLSPDLYATFWGLTLYDLYVPRSRYETEIAKQHNNLKALEELSDNSSSAIMKRKKDKEKTQELLDKLIAELQKHEEHVASVRERLAYEKDKWLSSCPDTLKINMEFLQRCIFPRCVFSMLDAVYCAIFVHTLHSHGTPYFNTVNHIDVLICKTLQPMICCCTEYEASRLGRFLYETLKMAYRWKSDESVYERECGNMPGFAVYYRYPNSKRVTFSQFVRVHTKWNTRITRLLIQCLESPEYIEIRNALVMLTKISSIFPVTRKTGLNLERRVSKIKNDEREDLKVLATGVAAALAARKGSWVSEEEFSMGLTDVKHAPSPAKQVPSNLGMLQNGPQNDSLVTKNGAIGSQFQNQSNAVKDQVLRAKISEGMLDQSEGVMISKSDLGQQKFKFSSGNSAEITSSVAITPAISKPSSGQTAVEESKESMKVPWEGNNLKISSKTSADSEARSHAKRSTQSATAKQPKLELLKDETRSERSTGKGTSQISSTGREGSSQVLEGRQSGSAAPLTTMNGSSISTALKGTNASTRSSTDVHGTLLRSESGPTKATDMKVFVGNEVDDSDLHEKPRLLASRHGHSPARDDSLSTKPADRQIKKIAPTEEQERLGKRRKGDRDPESKDGEGIEVQLADRERSFDFRDKSHLSDHEKFGNEEQSLSRLAEKLIDKTKDKVAERHEKDHRDKADRPDKMRGEDILDKGRDRSMERYGNERSVERMQDRGADRNLDRTLDKVRDERGKDDRSKVRHSEPSLDKSHSDDRFHGQSLPPPPPLPPSFVPQSFGGSRKDEEIDRRVSSRHAQRLSPKHDEKERRRSEENPLVSHEDAKRRREEDFRERKRDERDGLPVKAEEREREKGMISKDDAESTAASKRRKVKRDHPSAAEAGEYSPVVPPLPPPLASGASQRFDGRESGERKGTMVQRAAYAEESTQRMHAKESASKIIRRDSEQLEWEEEKRQRTEAKRKHRK